MKTWLLLVLFPVLLAAAVFWVFAYLENGITDAVFQSTYEVMIIVVPVLVIRSVIAFLFQRQLIFHFSGAQAVDRKQESEIYNIVENLCISRGLPVPRIGIIEEEGMNAFALGRRPSDSWVVFTRGLLNTLNRAEIEAVAAHELTHIINKDSLLMLVMVLYIGAVALFGELIFRFSIGGRSKDNENKGNAFLLVGIAMMLLGYLVYPLVRLAISRRREYLADAGAVELTKDNQAMISALRKIAHNPIVDIENKEMSAMFIESPLAKMSSWFQTHPSIEERIRALENY